VTERIPERLLEVAVKHALLSNAEGSQSSVPSENVLDIVLETSTRREVRY